MLHAVPVPFLLVLLASCAPTLDRGFAVVGVPASDDLLELRNRKYASEQDAADDLGATWHPRRRIYTLEGRFAGEPTEARLLIEADGWFSGVEIRLTDAEACRRARRALVAELGEPAVRQVIRGGQRTGEVARWQGRRAHASLADLPGTDCIYRAARPGI